MEDNDVQPRLSWWVQGVLSTQEQEVDCDDLQQVLEEIVRVAESGEDIRAVLPAIAVHLDHCPECGDWYQTLTAFSREIE